MSASANTQEAFAEALGHYKAGRLEDSVRAYRQILSAEPNIAEVHYNLGCSLRAQQKFSDAVACFERAIALQPKMTGAYINLGNVLRDQGRLDDAVKNYEQALAIDSASADAHYNLGTALKDQSKFNEAQAHYERALELRPEYVEAHNNLGVLLRDQGRLDEALRHFQKATAIRPDHVESHVNEAMTLLLVGDLAVGWRKYEWRRRLKGVKPFATDKPQWDGGSLQGKTILLHGEQGFGDCIQFVRYAPMVKEQGGRVLLVCPSALSRLFKTIGAIDQVIPKGAPTPDYDCHASLLSLPMLLGTTIDNIPNSVPYLFPDAAQAARWAERLKPAAGLMKVGLVWAGNSRPDHPAAKAVDLRRSMHITQFAPLAEIPGIQLFSLQKGAPARQLEAFQTGLNVIDHMNHVEDFGDTAAFIANLDLVIGVDTSVIHLAGAMGKPVWVLSRFDGCWRWLQNREDSPWYPTLRLFRQPATGDWQSVIEKVRVALADILKQH